MVAVAALICLMGVYATFSLATYAYFAKRKIEQRLWAAACVVSSATSTWATHFVAMLAFHPGTSSGFDPGLTAGSFLIALLMIGAGIYACVVARTQPARAAGGALIGFGISGMHYLGMAAYKVAGEELWSWPTVAFSVLCSVTFGVAGAVCTFAPGRTQRSLAPLMMLLAICSLHFTGMSAVTIVPDPAIGLPADVVQPGDFGRLVAVVTILLSALAMAGGLLDRSSRRRRRREKERLASLADVAVEGLMICDDGQVVAANTSLARLIGCDASALIGRGCAELVDPTALQRLAADQELETTLDTLQGQVPVRLLRRELNADGRRREVIAVRDQRERLRAEAEMRRLAHSDVLTGLPNRAAFQARLVDLASGRSGPFSVLLIDLDRFKQVNDSLGHAAGDLVLVRAAERLRRTVQGGDLLARLGGDEFAVLQVDAGDAEPGVALAGRIIEAMGRPFMVSEQAVTIGASVGVARAPTDGPAAEALLRNADLALHQAKADGRGAFRMFEPRLNARMQERRDLETRLRRAVARRDFELHYQPQVDAKSCRVTGAEALIRWHDPQRGLTPPSDFIPLAEEIGLIDEIGRWVLQTACAEAMTWPADLSVAVNLSPAQFHDPRLGDTIRSVLAETGLAPSRLELEITEGVLIAEESEPLALLNDLRAMGVRIAMDDFGTGYSSLSYLRRFAFDKLKVDRSFVRQLPESSESAAIVRAIVTMSSCLGMRTIVEGVETREQFQFSVENGCDEIQGFYFSRPLPAGEFHAFVRRWDREAA